MAPWLRKLVLTAHLVSSLGWIGAALTYVGLSLAAVSTQDPATVRAAWIAMELVGWHMIVPMALAALGTGVIMALGTGWGLVRHYWVLISLGLTLLAAGVTVLHMPTVNAQAALARRADPAELGRLGGDLVHPGIGVLVLLVITVLNVYKPRGLTRYGYRMQINRPRQRPPRSPVSTTR